jgi:hypothetical protein
MRRPVRLAIGMALVTALALPGLASAQTPVGDSVTGGGFAENFGTFAFDARSGPSGEDPVGQAALGPLGSSPIACLVVRDNVARIDVAGRIITVHIEVTDNAGRGVPDVVRGASSLSGVADCSPLDPSSLSGDVLEGDIVVVDASPRPATKDDCKQGGWRRFATFTNQGDCVSSVASRRPGG